MKTQGHATKHAIGFAIECAVAAAWLGMAAVFVLS
jgi:hypothetical protein